MHKTTLHKRDAVIIAVLFHVGIVLLWVSMGGCGTPDTREVDSAGTPDGIEEDVVLDTDDATDEPEITVTEEQPPVVENRVETRVFIKPGKEVEYVVAPGDSLWKISRKFGVTVKDIVERNDIQDATLVRAGRRLWIPNPTKGQDAIITEPSTDPTVETGPIEPVTGEVTGEVTTTVDPVDTTPLETIEYEVQPGDTIWKLARTYKTTTKLLMQLNNITDPKTLRAGDKILIPKPADQ